MLPSRDRLPYPVRDLGLLLWLLVLWLPVFSVGCAPKAPRIPGPLAAMGRTADIAAPSSRQRPGKARPAPSIAKGRRQSEDAVVAAARYYLEHSMRGFRDDCSGFVMAVYARAGLPIEGSTASFYAQAKETGGLHHRRDPRPGDLAFFDDTYDRNHNGKLDDDLSHVAIVMEVKEDGSLLLAHGGTSRGRTTLQMNLHHPDVRSTEEGAVYNDWLRVRRDSDPEGTHYLSGELWRAFATFDFPGAKADPADATADPGRD